MLKLGIDDAGRGPVIGPMVLAGVLMDSELEEELKEWGVKDSKLVKPEKREELAKKIKKKALSYKIKVIYPKEIDNSINDGTNLNKIEAIKSGEIINKINTESLDKIESIIDCPSTNLERWGSILKNYIDKENNLDLKIEHKADENHLIVGAASILAKSRREEEVRKIKKEIGKDIGSGYPSDPKTKQFLRDNVNNYKEKSIFRETWSTWINAKNKDEQKGLEDF